MGARRSDNFNSLTAFQGGAQGRQPAINSAGDAGVTNIGVHRISEIYRGRPLGEIINLAAW